MPARGFFFAREQAGHEPESATQIIACRIRAPLNTTSAALVARISGRAADDPVTLIRTFSLHGQMVIFHVASPSKLSMLGWKSIDAEKAELLKSVILEQTRTLLEQWGRQRDEERAPAVQSTGKGKSRKQQ
ncbi:CerR family C-terminal domain-containing protein [Paraburkholderia sp. BL23I1N1]|uniref:CerR family C-terminal domain-containing protein n=1 Tax=Paraburkholderia sp. BL23I1N1 TaxID=1938802 RepID=UPI0038F7D003